MAYRTILVHVDDARNVETRIALAAELALREDAHLVGTAFTGISRYVYESAITGMESTVLHGYMQTMQERAEQALERFEQIVRRTGLASWESRPVMDEPTNGLSLQARYADLCVLGQFDRGHKSAQSYPNLPEYVAMHGGAPVLVVPYAATATATSAGLGERCMLAWNGSLEAKHALLFALPLLQRAAAVEVVVFTGADLADLAGEQPGMDVAAYLARHGIEVELNEQPASDNIGRDLLALASEHGVDILVMGGYGHSRFREILLGGATRTVLQSMTLPVLLGH